MMTKQKPKQTKRAPEIIGTEKVTCRCGHVVAFNWFADKADKYRNERRKKLTDRDCPDCRKQAYELRVAQERENTVKRRQRKNLERLPDGAVFHVRYDAEAIRWSGTLTIQGTTFTDESPGVFRLLRSLDGKYRDALALVTAEENPESPLPTAAKEDRKK